MKHLLTAYAGIVGIVALLFSTLGYLLLGDVAVKLMLAHLVFGVLGVAVWALGSKSKVERQPFSRNSSGQAIFFGKLLLQGALLLCCLSLLYYGISKFDTQWDVTEQRIHSLAPQSRQLVSGLTAPLRLVAFDRVEEFPLQATLSQLELYKAENHNAVEIEVVDPAARPDLVELYGLNPGDALVVQHGKGDLSRIERLSDVSEEAITAAILRLVRGEQKQIYLLQGHGEPSTTSNRPDGIGAFVKAVEREHLAVSELVLADMAEVPSDAAAVIVASPKNPLHDNEQAVLKRYMRRGGRVLLFAEPLHAENIRELAAEFGIRVGKHVIIDRAERSVGAPQLGAQPIIRSFQYHPSTVLLSEKTPVVLNIATSVGAARSAGAKSEVVELMKTGEEAWAESDLHGVFESRPPRAELGESDLKGPVSVAAAVEWQVDSTDVQDPLHSRGRLVVVGDLDWLLNANLHWFSNKDLGLNLLGWLAEIEAGVSIRPRTFRTSLISISRATYMFLMVASFVLPELLLLVGLFVWYWRTRIAGIADST
jgi:ABC-type uncharacterized transport system involved in gliding motility auxiliary subunit